MTQLYYGLVTAVGTAKLAASAAGGASLTLSSMAFGDGGGVETSPTAAATALVNERYRAMLVEKYPHPTNPSILYVEGIIPPGVGGWTLREAGIYDAAGDLIVIAKMPAVNVALISEGASTEGVVRLPIVFDSASSVQILIDPSVVLATQAWVLERVLGRPWITVDSATTTAPPANPAAHALYLVPAGATGVWAGQAQKLAYYLGGWRYYSAPTAKRVSASDTGKAYRRTAGGWEELWVETEVSNVISKSGIATAPGSGMRLAQAIRSQKLNYVSAAGTANALTGTMDPPATSAPPPGLTLRLAIAATNTGPATLDVGWGAVEIRNRRRAALQPGDLLAGQIATVTFDGSVWMLASAPSDAATGSLLAVKMFSVPGTYVYTPTEGTARVIVEVIGGGGAGGGSAATSSGQASVGAGGGGGGYTRALLTTGFAGQTVTIAAATVGVVGTGGPAGKTSSFGTLLTAAGGGGGGTLPASAGAGSVGAAAAPASTTAGNMGSSLGIPPTAGLLLSGAAGLSGCGGGTLYGSGGGVAGVSSDGAGAYGYGGGGGGALQVGAGAARAGGTGTGGLVIIWEYI